MSSNRCVFCGHQLRKIRAINFSINLFTNSQYTSNSNRSKSNHYIRVIVKYTGFDRVCCILLHFPRVKISPPTVSDFLFAMSCQTRVRHRKNSRKPTHRYCSYSERRSLSFTAPTHTMHLTYK